MPTYHQPAGTDDLGKATITQILMDYCLYQLTQKVHHIELPLSTHPGMSVCPQGYFKCVHQ